MWLHAGFHCLVIPVYPKEVLFCCILISSLELLLSAAFLDLSGVHEMKVMWMGSTMLPCSYVPSEGFMQETLSWSLERDHSSSTIFRRDSSGDHVLLSRFRDRVSVPKDSPGNASLLIESLEITDSGHYTCQITWISENNSLVTKEVTTTVKVLKGKSSNEALLFSAASLTQEELLGIVFHTTLSITSRLALEAISSLTVVGLLVED